MVNLYNFIEGLSEEILNGIYYFIQDLPTPGFITDYPILISQNTNNVTLNISFVSNCKVNYILTNQNGNYPTPNQVLLITL